MEAGLCMNDIILGYLKVHVCLQKLQELRCKMKSKFDYSDSSDAGVKIAFKLPDGSKIEYKFPSYSTVKVSM